MIRIRAQGKYELLSTTGDDDFTSHDQAVRVEGILNREDGDVAEGNCSSGSMGSSGPRHRKSSRGDSEEKIRLLDAGADDKGGGEMIELSQKMANSNKLTRSSPPSKNSDFIQVDIKDDDTLQGLALKFRCPVSELKRVNNIYSSQDIHSFKRIKVPVKKHGLLKEILDDDLTRRRNRADDDDDPSRRRSRRRAKPTSKRADVSDETSACLVNVDVDDNDDDDDGAQIKCPDSSSRLELREDGGEWRTSSALDREQDHDASPSLPVCRYGIKDLENLFPNRDISDCESGSESRRRRLSTSVGSVSSDSDSASAPLVRTFYLSIRENMSSSADQSSLAKQFLSKMDADLSAIRRARPTVKDSLEEVASTLTSKRIYPLAPSPPPTGVDDEGETYGRVLGMNWRTLLGLGVGCGIFFFLVFFNYARQREKEDAADHRHVLAAASTPHYGGA